jgi:hypothetical protein
MFNPLLFASSKIFFQQLSKTPSPPQQSLYYFSHNWHYLYILTYKFYSFYLNKRSIFSNWRDDFF